MAVLLVFGFHYGGGLSSGNAVVRALGYVAQAGWVGVVLFFALSGYLITGSLQRDFVREQAPHSLRRFYQRRALRILPLYLLALTSAWVVMVLGGASGATRRSLLVYAGFLQNLPGLAGYVAAHPSPLPLYHLWSLAVEEQFYLLWPLLLLLALRAKKPSAPLWLTFWATLLSFGFRALLWSMAPGQAESLATSLPTQATALLLGAALALAPHKGRHAWTAFATGLVLFLFVSHLSGTFNLRGPLQCVFGLPAVSLSAAALIPLACRPGVLSTLLSRRLLRWLGRISYGIYIFHILLQPGFDWIAQQATHANVGVAYQTLRLFVALPLTILAAWLSFQYLELPALRLQSRLNPTA